MSASRLWPILVLALSGLPLFIGLGRGDLAGDEAIYSFGVDRILESGDWLAPKSSPHEDDVFLEKPPLKFWIIAAPIRLGLLPHNEFGLRFWDALFGAVSFLYVFALGRRLAGGFAGAVAVLILFVHGPLLFDHGLRSNNMEAALLLCYCGGVYHYFAWTTSECQPARRLHAVAVGLYFVLGFMTKFVAALFLPLVLAVSSLVIRDYRSKLRRDWRVWIGVSLLVVALCAPWFVYAYLRFGSYLWQVMFSRHVYDRFTANVDPEHVHPWYFYVLTLYRMLAGSGTHILAGIGLVTLLVQTVRRAKPEFIVLLLWFALPLFLISFGTSKLYHYAYPFLPPLAIAAGYVVHLILTLAPVPLGSALQSWNRYTASGSRTRGVLARPAVRFVCLTIALGAIGLAITSLLYGPVRLELPGGWIFRSRGILRPLMVAIVFGLLAGEGRATTAVVLPLIVASLLPLSGYREALGRLTADKPLMSAASDCIRLVEQTAAGSSRPGLYLDLPDSVIGHPMYYYFRRIRPWTRAESPSPARLGAYLYDASQWRPALVWRPTYQAFTHDAAAGGSDPRRPLSPAMLSLPDDVLLLLPGPYAACGADGSDRPAR